MHPLDWLIMALYIGGLLIFSYLAGVSQHNQQDYYLANRSLSWWVAGISVMATQSSAISFVSIPAFVALSQGGGLSFLQYEFALPIAMIILIGLLIPVVRRLQLVTVYEYLELRYGASVRRLVSLVFQISRGMGAGVAIYATAIVLSVALDWPLTWTIILIGVATVIYDTLGGMKAVVYSDVLQMIMLLGGVITCIGFSIYLVEDPLTIFTSFPEERRQIVHLSWGINDQHDMPFFAFVFGGLFLYLAYYGTDQSQIQRILATKSVSEAQKSMVFNGFAHLPFALLYIVFGMAIMAVIQLPGDYVTNIPADKPDYLVPQFIVQVLPAGVKGALFAALLAAAMSSIDSALNSLSAATMNDFIKPWRCQMRGDSELQEIWVSRAVTVVWGILITSFAFCVDQISDSVIVAVNKIGSAFYGPIFAAFAAGILSKKIHLIAIWCGIVTGVSVNLSLWIFDLPVHWIWWNAIGALVTSLVALIAGSLSSGRTDQALPAGSQPDALPLWVPHPSNLWLAVYAVVLVVAACSVDWLY